VIPKFSRDRDGLREKSSHPDLPSDPEFNQIPTAYLARTVGCLKVWKIYN
jgi:hypothetical protein